MIHSNYLLAKKNHLQQQQPPEPSLLSKITTATISIFSSLTNLFATCKQ